MACQQRWINTSPATGGWANGVGTPCALAGPGRGLVTGVRAGRRCSGEAGGQQRSPSPPLEQRSKGHEKERDRDDARILVGAVWRTGALSQKQSKTSRGASSSPQEITSTRPAFSFSQCRPASCTEPTTPAHCLVGRQPFARHRDFPDPGAIAPLLHSAILDTCSSSSSSSSSSSTSDNRSRFLGALPPAHRR